VEENARMKKKRIDYEPLWVLFGQLSLVLGLARFKVLFLSFNRLSWLHTGVLLDADIQAMDHAHRIGAACCGSMAKTTTQVAAAASSGESCIEKERQALLDIKADLQDPQNMLQEWGGNLEENKDCCKWVGVSCNNHTARVIGLDLSISNGLAGNISPSLPLLNQLQYLNLYGINFRSNTIPTFLGSLTNLQSLVISEANLTGPIPSQLGNLSSLVHLDLAGNHLVGSIPFSLAELRSLTYLDLSFNQLGGVIPESFGNHSSLVQMYLSVNILNGSIPDFVRCSNLSELRLNDNNLHGGLPNFTGCSSLSVLYLFNNSLNGSIPDLTDCLSLSTLYLANNQLSGNLPNNVGQLPNLINVDVSHNSLDGSLSDFSGCQSQQHLNHSSNRLNGNSPNGSGQVSNLQRLLVSYNSLHGSIPDFTGCPSLTWLDLSSNRLSGNLPNSIGQLAFLTNLDISNNSLEGVISDVHFQTFIQLANLDLSFNSFALELSSIPTQLETIKLQSCKLGPSFPMWLKTQKSYSYLDISSAGISDYIPVWFWDLPSGLAFLNLSSNEIKGKLQPGLHFSFDGFPGMDLSNNHFEGSVSIPFNLTSLNLSGNRFSGNLSFLCHFNWGLNFLDLSNNSFSGSLPDCFQNTILVLKLSNNNLSGKIPSSLGSLSKLEALYLRSNSFAGKLPMSLSNCTSLRFLDVGENKLSGVIPGWIGEELSELYVLVLGSNRFSGRLPSQICWLYNLQYFDLSHNGLSGDIPGCFGNFTAMTTKKFWNDMTNHLYAFQEEIIVMDRRSPGINGWVEFVDSAWVAWKGTKRIFGKTVLGLLISIDLSNNNFSGKLPSEITNLVELVSLNVSFNKLHGEIPKDMGRLKSLGSLDLSRNEFFGNIPLSLSRIDGLSYLDVSYNNLSGKIPTGTQLQGFDPLYYRGNPLLCGPPLTQRCDGFTPAVTVDGKKDDENDGDDFWRPYQLGMGVGFAAGFWGLCGTLFLNRRYRYILFSSWSHVKDWIYVAVALQIRKFKRF
nr:LRR receptor-like serine/threonine-protein kinase GSO2 [Tanacetum cinerariifolium]